MARNLYSFDDLENKFPVDVDDWHTFIDADLGMLSNIARYKQLYANGDLEGAAEVLNENPELRRAIINAETLNQFRDAIISIERFYLNDVQQWIIELVDYKGDFDSTTRYTKYDVVTFARNGAIETFVAHQIEIPIGTLPSDTNYWVPITLRGQQGASGLGLAARGTWNSLEQYTVNDWVIWNNKAWAAENDNTNSEPSEDNPDWYVVVDNYQRVVVSETEPTGQVAGDIWAQETENGVIFNEKQLDGTYRQLQLNASVITTTNGLTLQNHVDDTNVHFESAEEKESFRSNTVYKLRIEPDQWVQDETNTSDYYYVYSPTEPIPVDIKGEISVLRSTKSALQEDGISALMTENNGDGTLTIWCFGGQPTSTTLILVEGSVVNYDDFPIPSNVTVLSGGVPYTLQETEPKRTDLMWIDTFGGHHLAKVYDKTAKTWIPINAVWA